MLLGLGGFRTAPFIFSVFLASLMFGVVVSCKKEVPVNQPPIVRDFELLNIKLNNKQISILSLLFLFVFFSSCRTCKCPAYSQIEYQNPINIGDSTVKTVDFSWFNKKQDYKI